VTDGARRGLLPGLYLFLAALWAGALSFFAAAAGIVLKTAPTRADGGVVNRALLDALDLASLLLAALLIVLAVVLDRGRPWGRTARGLSIRLLVLAAVAAFVSLYLITPEMVALRAKAGPLFDALPAADPLRRAWSRLHALSSLTLLVRLVAAAALFPIGFRQLSGGGGAGRPEGPTP
jgi:hypothetical protein